MKRYDYILAGGGLAGLSLAYRLVRSGNPEIRDAQILIVDRDDKTRNDRTWCHWTRRELPFDHIVSRSWEHLWFIGGGRTMKLELNPYRYQVIHAIDLYREAHRDLAARPNVSFRVGEIRDIRDSENGAELRVDNEWVRGNWLFDSAYGAEDLAVDSPRYHDLKQHFLGVEIEAPAGSFDPARATLFDFRTPQEGVMRFVYVLPYTDRRALVEYTLFSHSLLEIAEYEHGVRDYIGSVLGVTEYERRYEESCVIPMTDRPFGRAGGNRIMRTGTKGGLVKPSTGYAFTRIQRDSDAIVSSLERTGAPWDVPASPGRYRLFDSILLQVLFRHGHRAEEVFTALFEGNPVQRVFSFLDEEDGPGQNLKLMATVPIPLFLRATGRVLAPGAM